MNNLRLPGLVLTTLLFCASLAAQTKAPLNEPDLNKPKLFSKLPAEVAISTEELSRLFTAGSEEGKAVSLKSAGNSALPALKGKIVSSTVKYENTLRSVVIRLDDFNGATLTLSSSTQPDGTVRYKGRIISFQHGDLYELQQKNKQYILVKRNFYELVNE